MSSATLSELLPWLMSLAVILVMPAYVIIRTNRLKVRLKASIAELEKNLDTSLDELERSLVGHVDELENRLVGHVNRLENGLAGFMDEPWNGDVPVHLDVFEGDIIARLREPGNGVIVRMDRSQENGLLVRMDRSENDPATRSGRFGDGLGDRMRRFEIRLLMIERSQLRMLAAIEEIIVVMQEAGYDLPHKFRGLPVPNGLRPGDPGYSLFGTGRGQRGGVRVSPPQPYQARFTAAARARMSGQTRRSRSRYR